MYSYFKDLPSILNSFVPAIDFVFIDLVKISDALLLKLSNTTRLKGLLLALKNVKNAEFLKENFSEFVNFSNPDTNYDDFVLALIVYLYSHSNLEEIQLDDIIESQKNKNMSSKVGIAYKQFEKRVKTEGAVEKTISVVRKGWQKNYPISEIADLASISLEEVKKLIEQFEKEKIKL